jgi:sulfur-carrier protein
MAITVLYFAGLREAIGLSSEQIMPWKPASIGDLRASFVARGGAYATAFAATRNVRAAINQNMVKLDAIVNDGDEVAFFPPVTGG